MDTILRTAVVYVFLLLLFRINGKRTLGQITTFDFILLLIVGDATENALVGNDFSLTNAFLVIITLMTFDIVLSFFKDRSKSFEQWTEGVPTILVYEGKLLEDRLKKSRVGESDVMTAARELQGLENLEQIKFAVLEKSGGITIIPKQ